MDGFAEVNGTRLYYEMAGEGPPLALVHGLTLDTRMWDDQFAVLAAHHHVIRYDLRGFGRSAPTGDMPYTHADDLAALLDHLRISRSAVLGLSLGGRVAIDFTLAYPARTRALIAVDAALSGYRWSEEWNTRWRSLVHTARTVSAQAANQRWLDHPLFAPANEQPAVAARLRRMVGEYSGWHWGNRDPQRGFDSPATARLCEITAPTLVIVGERDLPDFHVIADTLTQGIPKARMIVLPGVGHMANMESPERFTMEVSGFLQDI